MLICAVFEVARLTDQDDVGVLPEERAKRGGEGAADPLVDLTWFTPFRLYSTGSSASMMFTSGELIRVNPE